MTTQFIICDSCVVQRKCLHKPREWCADYVDRERLDEEIMDWRSSIEQDEPDED